MRTFKWIIPLFSVFFAFAYAQADSSLSSSLEAPNEALGESELGIINLSEQDLSPELRDCLKKKPLGECLQKSLRAHTPKLLADDVDQDMVGLWRGFLQSQLTPGSSLLNTQPAGIYFGLNLNGAVIDMDEVASDPNKIATDQKLGNRALWVKHDLELLPQVGSGFNTQHFPSVLENPTTYFGGALTASAVMRITKRHPMDEFYNKNLWGYLNQDLHLAGQALPMYLRVIGFGPAQEFLPGEGIEIERYGSIALGVGPAANIVGFPSAINTIGAGVFASAQFVFSIERGHFRTTMEVQTDGTLHVTLDRINQDSEKLDAEISAGAGLGPLSYVASLIRLETGVVHTKENLLDMVFDPKYPEAIKALRKAYVGFFTDAQNLAANANTHYQGVRGQDHTSLAETEHERDFQFFFYDKGSTVSETTASTNSTESDPDEADVHEADVMDDMSDHRSTSDSQRSVDIAIDTDSKNPDPATNRSMSLKYKFASNNALPEEVQSFLTLAQTFGPVDFASDLTPAVTPDVTPDVTADVTKDIKRWTTKLQTDQPTEKRGHFEAYFYAGLDSKDVSELLQNPDKKISSWTVSWAKSLGYPNPEAWGTMTDQEQKAAAKKINGGKAHLKAFKTFVQAIREASTTQGSLKQAQRFVKEIRGIDFDIYPLLSIMQSEDRNNLATMERLTLGDNPATEDALQYSSIGTNYSFPKRTEN